MTQERRIATPTFRKAVGADGNTISELLGRVKLPTESVGTESTLFFVGEIDGTVAAVAGFEFYGNDALLRSVAVRPELQHKGLGDRITDFMIATARARHVRRIILLTETAEAFFAKRGFVVTERAAIDNQAMIQSSEFTSACPTSAVCMVLRLGL